MKLSLNWLNDYVSLDGLSTEEIIEKTIKAGFEVEEITYLGYGTDLVVGKVIECHDHPDSDHLHITKVDIGTEILDIVCGAPNCREGLKVIVAKVGCKLVGGEIKASKIRGAVSNGMLCSLLECNIDKELLPDNSPSLNGIEELSDDFVVGETDILKKLGYGDIILDLSIYANRPDCLSMFGMAQEMAAILDRPCVLPDFSGKSAIGGKANFRLSSTANNCTHFLAKVINKVTIGDSPAWLKHRLISNGIKAINNLVDISNYVMLETGQPLHFYDLRSNPAREITVKDDYEGSYQALDGNEYLIEKGDLMITSENQPIGIAGIMGGDNTKILDDTHSLIIEAALFDHTQIRRTANRLGLQTEAAARFAKGLDPMAQNYAMDRAVQLLMEYAGAADMEETVEYGKADYEPYTVVETLEHLNALIGKKYTTDEVVSVLNRLAFNPEVKGDNIIAHIPSRRASDITIREDIDEEVVRLTDFDDLESTLPYMPQTIGKLTDMQNLRRFIKNVLCYNGLYETVSYSLVNKTYIDDAFYPLGEAISLMSPLSDARKYVRNSLMNSMLEVLSYNLDHSNENVNIFEISKVYAQGLEQERLGIVLNGNLYSSRINKLTHKTDFYALKAIIMDMLAKLGFEKGRIQVCENEIDTTHLHPFQSCVLKMNNKILAIFGKIHPVYAAKWKIKDTYYAEIILDDLGKMGGTKVKAPQISRYPAISRDLSIVVKDDVKADELIKLVKKAGGNIVKNVEVFDIYQGKGIEEGYKSVSLNIVYEDKDKTLKVEDINAPQTKIINELNNRYNANLRV